MRSDLSSVLSCDSSCLGLQSPLCCFCQPTYFDRARRNRSSGGGVVNSNLWLMWYILCSYAEKPNFSLNLLLFVLAISLCIKHVSSGENLLPNLGVKGQLEGFVFFASSAKSNHPTDEISAIACGCLLV